MRLTIVAVGRLKDDAERVLADRYVTRCRAGRSVGLGPLEVIELPESRRGSAVERKLDEAARIRSAIRDCDRIVVLDETGKQRSSTEFARWLDTLKDNGSRHLALVIGGADGLDSAFRDELRDSLSLGRLTLPHGIARVVVAEQIYRAITILSGHPYHRA